MKLVVSRGPFVNLRCVSCEWDAGRDFASLAEMRKTIREHLKKSPECNNTAPYPDSGFEFAQGGAIDLEMSG